MAWRTLLLVALALPGMALAQGVVRTYEARERDAQSLAEAVGPLLSEGARAHSDVETNTVIVSGERDAVASALEVLRLQDRPPTQIDVFFRVADPQAFPSGGLDWVHTSSSIRTASLGPATRRRPPARRITAGPGRLGDWSAVLRLTQGREGRVVEGRGDRLRSLGFGWLWGGFVRDEGFLEARSGLVARAVVLAGGRIRLELQPFTATITGVERDSLETLHTKTIVTVEDGAAALIAATGARFDQRALWIAAQIARPAHGANHPPEEGETRVDGTAAPTETYPRDPR